MMSSVLVSDEEVLSVLLRLAVNNRLSLMLELIDARRPTIIKLATDAGLDVRRQWLEALSELADYVALVSKNNPGKPIRDILNRADVQDAIHRTIAESASVARTTALESWKTAQKRGLRDGSALMKIAGEVPKDVDVADFHAYLSRIEADITRNSADAVNQVLVALSDERLSVTQVRSRISTIARRHGSRARAGANVAFTKGYNDAVLARFGDTPKMWVTRFGPNTCPSCAALHGKVIPAANDFPTRGVRGGTKSVFVDLLTPPRHPLCHCVLVPFTNDMLNDTGMTPKAMTAFALNFLAEQSAQAAAEAEAAT